MKSAPRLVEELDRLHARYGHSEFKLDHDLFTVSKRKVREFCEAVTGRGYRWRVSARVDCVDEPLLEQMADSGCVGLYFGIETGSKRMQKESQKRLKLDLVAPTLDTTERLGIEATVSFITGYPQERQEDQDATLDMLGRCFRRRSGSVIPQLHILAPEPGTPLFTEFGCALRYDGYATNFNAALLGADDEETVRSNSYIFPNYFYYPTSMPRDHHTFAVDALDVFRILGTTITDYLLRFYRGRLSILMAELRIGASRGDGDGGFAAPRLEDFIAHAFGESHHLSSLVRYALVVHGIRSGQSDGRDSGSFAAAFVTDGTYRLANRALVMSDIHDCGELLKRIRALSDGDTLDEGQAGRRVHSLTVVGDSRLDGYVIDAGVVEILALFQAPHRVSDIVALPEPESDGRETGLNVFRTLVDIGALTLEDTRRIPELDTRSLGSVHV